MIPLLEIVMVVLAGFLWALKQVASRELSYGEAYMAQS